MKIEYKNLMVTLLIVFKIFDISINEIYIDIDVDIININNKVECLYDYTKDK